MNPLISSTPFLSLIIPTRERADTLLLTIATVLQQDSQDFEIIISDNASTDNTKHIVGSFSDNRIRYFNTGKRISMCDNYEFGLSKARGDYVIIIGDDDAVVEGGLDLLIDLLRCSQDKKIHMWPLHIYDWPVAGGRGMLAYKAKNSEITMLSLKTKARSVMRMGGWKYYELPSPYHSAVPREMLDKIKQKTGKVFNSTQPDVFTAMALPAFEDSAINLGISITFHGRSPKSNGMGFVDESAKVNIDHFLAEYAHYEFHTTLLPKAGKSCNMIPDAILKAYDFFPNLYGSTRFSYEAMWAFSYRHGFITYLWILKNISNIRKKHEVNIVKLSFYISIHKFSAIRRKFLNFLLKRRNYSYSEEDIFGLSKELGFYRAPRADIENIKDKYKALNKNYLI